MKKKRPFWQWLLIGVVSIAIVAAVVIWRMPKPNAGMNIVTPDMQTVTLRRAPLVAVIGATGMVRSSQQAVINWQTSGKVGEVSADLGEKVAVDQLLASLDPNTISQSIIQAQADLIDAQAALEDLKKPQPLKVAQAEAALEQAQDELDTLLNPSEADIARAELAVLDAQDAVNEAQRKVDNLQYPRGSTQSVEQARASYLVAQAEVERMQSIYEDTPGDPDSNAGKALALSNLAAAESKRDRALATLNWYLGDPTDTEVAEKNTNLIVAQGQLADAQEALEKLRNPKPSDITLAEARVEDARETLEKAQNGPTADDLAVAESRVTLARAALNQAGLTAPFAGTVTQVKVMPGDMVSAGQAAFRIDDLSKLFVDLDVSEIDIAQIQEGQAVSITFDSIPDQEYSGVVTSIGLVGSLQQNMVYFPVTVQLTNPDRAVKPGMTAIANIVISQVDDVLQLPNRAIRSEDGTRFVYVVRAGVAEKVIVKVGMVSDTASEVIAEGLREGDQVLLGTIPESWNRFGPGGGPMGRTR
ncbi:MAG: efflux RND transporter periplasmic adaptor subunit [Chloroflexota bacterium]